MKKLVGILAVLGIMTGSSAFALDLTYGGATRPYTGPDVTLILNEEKFVPTTEQMPPVILENRTLVPAREVFEKLGGTVEWNSERRLVTIRMSGKTIELTIDNKSAIVNGKVIELDVPARIINNKTMVPVRFISEKCELNVDWNGETHTVTVTDPNAGAEEVDEYTPTAEMQVLVDSMLKKSEVPFRMPMTTKILKVNAPNFIGLTEEQFEKYVVDSVVHESGISPANSSLCIVKLSEDADVAKIKKDMLDNCNLFKWVCMGADHGMVIESGRYVLLMMGDEEQCKAMEKAFTEHFGKANVGTAMMK